LQNKRVGARLIAVGYRNLCIDLTRSLRIDPCSDRMYVRPFRELAGYDLWSFLVDRDFGTGTRGFAARLLGAGKRLCIILFDKRTA